MAQEYSGWTLSVPTHAVLFSFEAAWAWWDGNTCGDGTAQVSIPHCGIEFDLVRGSDVYGPFACDVTGLTTLTINKPHSSGCACMSGMVL